MTSREDLAWASHLARRVKEELDLEECGSRNVWTLCNTVREGETRIQRDDLFSLDENEYKSRRSNLEDTTSSFDADVSLREWVSNTSEEEIASLIDTTPHGLASDAENKDFFFTAWQRISMAHWVNMPFDVTSCCTADGREVRYSLLKGSFPDRGILDLPLGCGKTAWACSVASMSLSDQLFCKLRMEYRTKNIGNAICGFPTLPVARIAIFSVSPSSFSNYVSTMERLIPVLERKWEGLVFHLWKTMDNDKGVLQAYTGEDNHVFFWILPVGRVNSVLRKFPCIAVAMHITEHVGRRPSNVSFSPALKEIAVQGDPRSFYSSAANGTWVSNMLSGDTSSRRKGICMMNVLSLSAYRSLVRSDLHSLFPPEIVVHRMRYLESSVFRIQKWNIMLPATLCNVLLSCVRPFCATTESLLAFVRRMSSAREPEPRLVVSSLEGLVSHSPSSNQSCVLRVVERMKEFGNACPICLKEKQTKVRVFGCCGYSVCSSCYTSCLPKCPFCRVRIPLWLKRSQVEGWPEEATISYPSLPSIDSTLPFSSTLHSLVTFEGKEMENLAHVLHCLVSYGYRRILFFVEKNYFSYWEDGREKVHIHFPLLTEVTGVQFFRMDTLSKSGMATQFAKTKKKFDSSLLNPISLVDLGTNRMDYLLDVNFDNADSVIIVGKRDKLDSIAKRIFRPKMERSSLPIRIVCLDSERRGTQTESSSSINSE